MVNKDYPFKKVIFLFTLAPVLAGMGVALLTIFNVIIYKDGINNIIYSLILIPVFMLYGLVLFGVPSAVLGGGYALIRLTNVWWSYIVVFIMGGSTAFFWAGFFLNGQNYSLTDFNLISPMICFFLGAVSSLVIAFFVLPENKNNRGHPSTFD